MVSFINSLVLENKNKYFPKKCFFLLYYSINGMQEKSPSDLDILLCSYCGSASKAMD